MNVALAPGDMIALPTLDVLGIEVAALRRDQAIALFHARLAAGAFTRVAFLNAHNANVASADPEVRRLFRSFLMLPDGVGVDIAAKVVHGSAFPANLNGTDFVPELLRSSLRPLTIGLVGARRENADRAAQELRLIAPQHRVEVVHDGYFGPETEIDVLQKLRELKPDVLLVALGVPRQEFWIAEQVDARHCTVAIAVGALLDFLAGAVPRAPLWVRRWRLEWLFRMYVEPGRLWRRYVLGNPVFLARVAAQKFGLRPR